jgi:ribosomal protein S18 acetylase RimI-like enzyme
VRLGILGMMVGVDQFNGKKLASVNFWYVAPEARHLGLGKDLLRAAEAIAQDAGCYRMLMGHPLGHTKFFQSNGFKPIEIGYQKVF